MIEIWMKKFMQKVNEWMNEWKLAQSYNQQVR